MATEKPNTREECPIYIYILSLFSFIFPIEGRRAWLRGKDFLGSSLWVTSGCSQGEDNVKDMEIRFRLSCMLDYE